MNDIEKKRQQIASVNEHIESISEQDFEQMSEQSIESVKEQLEFDRQLKKALDISVPEGLDERIMLNNATQQRSNRFKYFAMAASITLVLAMSLLMPTSPKGTLSAEALTHVYHEEKYLTRDEQVSAKQLQARLDKMGFKLAKLPEHVTFATKCGLGLVRKACTLLQELMANPLPFLSPVLASLGQSSFVMIPGSEKFAQVLMLTWL